MQQVFKIALPGYNAFTDTDPDHFALFVDQSVDYILIKEKEFDTITVDGTENIAHNLGYTPFCLVFAKVNNQWRKLFGTPIDLTGAWFEVNDTNLEINTPSSMQVSYHIFYDKIA